MSRRLQRLISFILAMILTLSSTNIAFAIDSGVNGDTVMNVTSSTGSGSGSVSSNGSDEYTSGYKIELVHLELSDETYNMKNDTAENRAAKTAAITEEWNAAQDSESDSQHSGNVIQKIGNPIYITSSGIYNASGITSANAFKYGDFDYGLGSRAETTGIDRGYIQSVNLVPPSSIISKAASISYTGSDLASYMTAQSYDLPIYVGKKSQQSVSLLNYFLKTRPESNQTEYTGDYIANSSLAALVNYISTSAGSNTSQVIYFKELYDNKTNTIVYPTMPDSTASSSPNCFDTGIWKSKKGEYRLIISPFYYTNVSSLGQMYLTARDFIWVATNPDSGQGTGEGTAIYNQGNYFKQLCANVALSDDDFFDLLAAANETWGTKVSDYMDKINNYYGGGIFIISSAVAQSDIAKQETYIGSVSHIFLPGSLSDSQTEIKTASMEYLGPKADETGTSNAMTDAATNIGRALAGVEVNSDTFGTGKVTQDLILNGTIKIPGISSSSSTAGSYQTTNAYAANNQSELIKALEDALHEYTDDESAVRDGIIEVVKEYLGIDLSAPISTTSNTINMQDLNLVIYCLAHYQQDGLEATSGDTSDALANGANRWKQILAYQAMLENKASSQYIQESKGWVGPLSITWDDIANLSNSKVKGIFESYPLGKTADEINALSSTYSQTASDAKKAIDNDVLDNVDKGQISTTSDSSTGELTTWSDMAKAEELELGNGLVRKPVAMGNTQFYLGSGTDADESINVPKGYIGRATSDVLKGAVEDYLETKSQNGLNGFDHINLATGLEYLWGSTTVQTDGIYNSDLVETSLLVDPNVDFNEAGRNDTLFDSVVKGSSYNSSYGNDDLKVKGKEQIKSVNYNTFGLNTLVDVGIAGLFAGNTGTFDGLVYSQGIVDSNSDLSADSEGAVVVPSYVYATSDEFNESTEVENIQQAYYKVFNGFNRDPSTLNDAIFASESNNDKSLILAVNNYMLNRGLSANQAQIATTVAEGTSNYNVTNMVGEYGASYVIWDKAMPVDIQFVTELNGEIVPIEWATSSFDNGLISNVWYASANSDTAVQLQKYYTVTDTNGNEVTLEVEEAVVKSALVNDAETLNAFYKEYTKAYNNDEDGFFSYKGSDGNKYYTKRTVFSNSSSSCSNVDTYIRYTADFEGSAALRYISYSGDSLGLPTALSNVTATTVNTIDLVATDEDMAAYEEKPTLNRLQVIVKVSAVNEIKQYNMIEGLEGNYVEEVEPQIVDGKLVLDSQVKTGLGYAVLEATRVEEIHCVNGRVFSFVQLLC